ncbi:MAG: hypothetical protein L3J53_08090 [Proteobacteria bacterium]|nr:hypothetical protein [Pseudomonadota bacterium]
MIKKTTRVIYTHKLSKNTTSLLRSYCHLLKNQLNDKWIIHITNDAMAQVVFISDDYTDTTLNHAQYIIRIVDTKRPLQPSSSTTEHLLYLPIESHELVKTLNNVSTSLANKTRVKAKTKPKFSIKQMLTAFIYGNNKIGKSTTKKPTTPIKNTPLTDKLLNMSDPAFLKTLKIVFLGRPGAGKTTAIISAETKNLIVCDVNASDSIGLLKEQTTIGIDYCDCNYTNGIRLKLFGTPGQGRYNYLQLQTISRAEIYVVLVDLTSVAPLSEFQYYNNILESPEANPNAIKLVAFTHYDLKEHDVVNLSRIIKRKCNGQILTAILDPRDRKQVRDLLEEIALLSLEQKPVNSIYNNNTKSINLKQYDSKYQPRAAIHITDKKTYQRRIDNPRFPPMS